MDGGADDEVTLRRNTSAFDDYELLPTQLSDISDIDMETEVLGANVCSIGRGYLFGLAADGERGILHALRLLKGEVERTLALAGCN